ncbi:MAG: YfhO family protein [Acidobacteriota bacterium]
MLLLLYGVTALGLLGLAHRYVRPLSAPAALVLLVLPMGLLGPALVTGRVYGPVDILYEYDPLSAVGQRYGMTGAHNPSAVDIISEFFPWRLAVRESFRRGEWPLWNGYNLCGHPLAAEAQSAPYSPFTWIACLLPAAVSMSYSAAIVLFLAGLGAFLFARELECREGVAFLAAVGWSLAASIVLYSLTAMGFATAYLALLLVATHRIAARPGVASGALLTTVLSLTLLAGHPESLYLDVLVASAYGAFELVRRRERPWRAIAAAAGAGLATLLVCAVFLLPLLEAIPQSAEYRRKSGRTAAREISGPQVLAGLATNVFPQLHVRSWESPRLSYVAAETGAVGSILLGLAVYALWRVRGPRTWFFGALALFGIAVGSGWPPLLNVLRRFPLFGITQLERFVFAAALALVILAALAFEEILRRRDDRAAALTLAVVLLFLSAGAFWIARNVVLGPATYGHHRLFAELFFLAMAAALFGWKPPLRVLVPALLGLVCAQRVLSEMDTFRTYPAEVASPPIPLLANWKEIREPFRAVGVATTLPPATNTFYGFEDPRGYEALTLGTFVATDPLWCSRHGIWFNRVDDLTRPFLSFLNVRFAMQRAALPVPAGWRTRAEESGTRLLENENVIERAFVPAQVALTDMTADDVVGRMWDVRDFRSIAWIETDGAAEVRANGPGRVSVVSRTLGGRYLLDVTMEHDGFVILSDTAWKGWRAWIDGRAVKVGRANAAFLAIFVPQGHHSVRMQYRPRSFETGATITLATLLLIAAYGVWHMRRQSAGVRRRE